MKHLTLALLALGFSSAALAGHHDSRPSAADISAWQAALLQKNQHNAGINH